MTQPRACHVKQHLLQTTASVTCRDNGIWAHFLLRVNDMSMFYDGQWQSDISAKSANSDVLLCINENLIDEHFLHIIRQKLLVQ